MNMHFSFSRRALTANGSAIREILKVTERPEIISFAGGLPSPAAFPVERIRAATEKVLRDTPHAALQYGPSEGFTPLRHWIAERLSQSTGQSIDPSHVLITAGSQQALDLIGKALIDEGSKVAVETPSYLGALQAFSLFGPDYVSLPSDEEGLNTDALSAADLAGIRFVYCLPNFQNPTGSRLPLARREALVALAAKAGVPLVEDDPYGELSYRGTMLPSLLSMNPAGVIYMGSFSKVLSPGCRMGYIVAPEPLFSKLIQLKQAADLHTSSFTQQIVFETVRDGFLEQHIPGIRQLYGDQCRLMLDALERYFPAEIRWSTPEGGMFIWVTLPEGMESSDLLMEAIKRNVAFVPGEPFYASNPQNNTLRLSFVTVPGEAIDRGIRILGDLIKEKQAASSKAVFTSVTS